MLAHDERLRDATHAVIDLAFLLRVVQERGRRAIASGRVPTAEAYEGCLSARWQRLHAVNALEMVTPLPDGMNLVAAGRIASNSQSPPLVVPPRRCVVQRCVRNPLLTSLRAARLPAPGGLTAQ